MGWAYELVCWEYVGWLPVAGLALAVVAAPPIMAPAAARLKIILLNFKGTPHFLICGAMITGEDFKKVTEVLGSIDEKCHTEMVVKI